MSVATATLSEVADINPRFDRAEFSNLAEVVTFVPMAQVSEVSGAITSEDHRPVGELLKGFTPFADRDVLVAKITPCFENGKIAHARISKRAGFGSTEFHVIRADAERLDDRYLFHFLRQPLIRVRGEKRMTGSGGQRRVPKAFLESLDVPLPPLAEQRRIAAILDKADALRAKRREAIAKLDQLLQSVFLDMFGDPVGNPKLWPVVKVGDVFSEFVGGKNVSCPDESSSPYRILKVSAVTSKVYRPEESKPAPERFAPRPEAIVESGDLLFSRANTTELVAATAYVWKTPEGMVLPDKLWKMRLADKQRANVFFLWGLFKNVSFRLEVSKRSSGTSGSMKNIAKSKLVNVPMPLPPISLQDRFAQITEVVERQKGRLQAQVDEQKALFVSLQERAFSGTL